MDEVSRNWNLNPLSAIPEVNGLRPIDLDDVSMKFVRYLAYISECEEDVSNVQALMIEERDRRLKDKGQYEEKDNRLKTGDLKAIYERHYEGPFQTPQGKGCVVHKDEDPQGQWRETSQYHVRAGQAQRTIPSTWDSGGFQTSEGSSSRSSTPLFDTIHVMQPERLDDVSTSRKRRDITDDHISPRFTKRPKPLVTTSGQVTEMQPPSPATYWPMFPGLRKYSQGLHKRRDVVEHEAREDNVVTQCVAMERPPAVEAMHVEAQLSRGCLETQKRSLSNRRTIRTPTMSPLSDGPTEQPEIEPSTTTVTMRRDPIHHMLDKITTGFTDNLFFLHGVLRTYADADTARARGEALDAAAADLLVSISTFRKRVELISEGFVERPYLPPSESIPATHERLSKPPTTAGDRTARGAVSGKYGIQVDTRLGERGYSLSQGSRSPEEQDDESTARKDSTERRAETVSRKPCSEEADASAGPEEVPKDPLAELYSNPWSAELD